MFEEVSFEKDASGTPGIRAPNDVGALYGMGVLHARYRPLQTLLLPAVGRGILARSILPVPPLVRLDALSKRLGAPERGERAAEYLSEWASARIDAYLVGIRDGLALGGQALELKVLASKLPQPDRAALISGFILSAFLGLAESQERMERALVEALSEGADHELLSRAFSPHLDGWEPDRLGKVARPAGLGFSAHGLFSASGSNAWAVNGTRSQSGHALFAADPHLQVNQLPALFFETRIRVGDDYWLGATIPGLPGIAVGRNRNLAWSGTFGVADNVDFHLETIERGLCRSPDGEYQKLAYREVVIERRFMRPLKLSFYDTPRGSMEHPVHEGESLSVAWAGADGAGEAIESYLKLPLCKTAAEAERALNNAHTLSLHFVLADRSGDVRYRQVGRIPKRTGGWSGLYPAPVNGPRRWDGFYTGATLPKLGPEDGIVATANEGRPAPDGAVLSTLAQPRYRLNRIQQMLQASAEHTLEGFQKMHLDVLSLQAMRLTPVLVEALAEGPLRAALSSWDRRFDVHSRGARAFQLAYRFALSGLAPELGGAWFETMLDSSELSVWWCAALDRLLLDVDTWRGARGRRIRASLASIAHCRPERWGDVHQVHFRNLVLGGLPAPLKLDRGPYPFPGSIGTVCQGNVLHISGQETAVGPAYRFVCDLSEDRAFSSIPGGVDGSPLSQTYANWLDEHLAGRYHEIKPPA